MTIRESIVILCAMLAAAIARAEESLPAAFTQEELRDQARIYVSVMDKKEQVNSESAIKMSQFYGYIMGYLDSKSGPPITNKLFTECTKKSPKEVVLKAAKVIVDSKLDRTESVRSTATFAVLMACTDDVWTKQ